MRAWRRVLGPLVEQPPRMEVRLSCGYEFVLEADTAEPLFDVEEKLTDLRPGFTTIPAEMVNTGQRLRINRQHVTMVRVR